MQRIRNAGGNPLPHFTSILIFWKSGWRSGSCISWISPSMSASISCSTGCSSAPSILGSPLPPTVAGYIFEAYYTFISGLDTSQTLQSLKFRAEYLFEQSLKLRSGSAFLISLAGGKDSRVTSLDGADTWYTIRLAFACNTPLLVALWSAHQWPAFMLIMGQVLLFSYWQDRCNYQFFSFLNRPSPNTESTHWTEFYM